MAEPTRAMAAAIDFVGSQINSMSQTAAHYGATLSASLAAMGDIKVGDYVIGQNGKPTKVTGVYPHKNWQFYKVTFSDGVYTECGKEHLWAVSPLYDRRKKKPLRH